jgi:hypothetical protein
MDYRNQSSEFSKPNPHASTNNDSLRWPFEISRVGSNWLEKVSNNDQQTVILGGDGTTVYLVLSDRIAKKKFNLTGYAGNVFSGEYPIQSLGFNVTVPWLAYCLNPAHFDPKNDSLDLPAPWLFAWQDSLAYVYSCKYEPLEGGLGLPKQLTYQPDPSLMDAFKHGRARSLVPPNEEGKQRITLEISRLSRIKEPEAVYKVLTATNVNGITIPTAFSFTQYAFFVNKITGSVDKKLLAVTTGVVTSVEPLEICDPIPRLSGEITNIQVADYRFFNRTNRVGFINYVATNSAWITDISDPLLTRLYASEVKRLHSRMPFVLRRRGLVAGTLILLFSLPVLIALFQARKTKQQKTNTNEK